MRPLGIVPIERYLVLRRRFSHVSLYIGLALLFGAVLLLIWLETSSTIIGVALVGAVILEVVVYSKLFEYSFGNQGRVGQAFAPSCAKCGGMMIVDERDKDNEVGTTKYYAELDETDEVFECPGCGNAWRNLHRR
jgi:predicted RNA-binding Zn-ribbon protein involved in translation (DUF1610 family)